MKKIYELVFVMLSVLSFTGYISAEPSFISKTDFATGHAEYAAFENLNGDENPAIASANTSSSTTVKLQQPPPNQLRITESLECHTDKFGRRNNKCYTILYSGKNRLRTYCRREF